MDLETLIRSAHQQGASDLHLEGSLPPAMRVRGSLKFSGDPLSGKTLSAFAESYIPQALRESFLKQRSLDFSRTVEGIRCRFNIFHTSRGVAFSIRLLSTFQATLEKLNLHPDFKKFVAHRHGLLLVSGPTGSGKSSTLAALVQEINLTEPSHVITIESPIEHLFRPGKAFIRQREVGRDTPSFEQALLDSLREDPDVLMVGEMRDPETMRLTLNAAETGHLVLATVHSSSCSEALQRVISAFPSEVQNNVAAQLADCLVGVIAQRLRFRPEINLRVPECEVLVSNNPIKNFIRNRDFFKIPSVLETGAEAGMWTFARYQTWLQQRTRWHIPPAKPELEMDDPVAASAGNLNVTATSPPLSFPPARSAELPKKHLVPTPGRIEIEPIEGAERILKKP